MKIKDNWRWQKFRLGLVAGRHKALEKHVRKYIFQKIKNIRDLAGMQIVIMERLKHCCKLDLYVTGLQAALAEVINYCIYYNIELTLWHYNKRTKKYFSQKIIIGGKNGKEKGSGASAAELGGCG